MLAGIDSSGDRQSHEFQCRVDRFLGRRIPLAKHDRSDFDGANAIVPVQCHSKGLRRELGLLQVRQEFLCIHIDSMAPGWLHDRDAALFQQSPQRLHLSDAIAEILLVEHFLEPPRHRFQISPCQSAVGRKSLDEDQHVGHRLRPSLIIEGQESTDVDQAILFG